ncbi:MAG: LysR family transcriptional regulator [Anaerolineales bacterium]|nr:MAG: LysR family transcriptional regulator [Anaerolineales bacterium]
MSRVNLDHVRSFLEVIRRGSLSEAARAVGVSQPAVSNQIKGLERGLGMELLIRGERGVVSLTAAGEVFLAFAEQVVAAHEEMLQRVDHLKEEVSGALVIAASTTPGEFVLPQLLSDFKARYPQVEARVTIADTRDVVEKVLAHECDIGFIGAPIKRPRLTLTPLIKDEIVLAVYPDHPFAGQEAIRLEELQGQRLILREEGSGTRRSLEQLLAERAEKLPADNVVLVLGSTHAIIEAIQARLGIGFVSAFAVSRLQASGQLGTVPIKGLSLTRDLFVAYEESQLSTRLRQEFLAFAQEWAHSLAGGGLQSRGKVI